LQEDEQAAACRKAGAVRQGRGAGDVLHYEGRQTRWGGAPIDDVRDIGVLQSSQDLPLRAETAERALRIGAALEQLDGDLQAEIVLAYGAIDDSHSAFADQPGNGVAIDARADQVGAVLSLDGKLRNSLNDGAFNRSFV